MLSLGYLFYNTIISLAGPPALALAALRGRLRGNWPQRLGLVPRLDLGPRPRVWVHAVSVGEVQVAAALMEALGKTASHPAVWLTTATLAGLEAAQEMLPPGTPVLMFPLDAYASPGRALARLGPDLVIILETELWPNFIKASRRQGVKVMLANGRISPRSVAWYRRFRFLFREVLGYVDLMAMIQPEDRDRIISIGADPGRVQVAGSAKYDLLLARAEEGRAARLGRELGIAPDRPVLVAGSTRSGEEVLVLDVFERLRKEFPDLGLILAPRHVDRSDEVEALIRGRGLSLVRRGRNAARIATAPDVILVDVMGELFFLYGLATVAFCGASLVPLGGQNPLEPAVWGKPVLYGPFMEDFLDARQILEDAGAGRTVQNQDDFFQQARELLSDRELACERGRAGRRALEVHQGAAERLAGLALGLLAMDKKKGT